MEIEAIFFPVRAFRWYEEGPMRRQLGGIYPSMNPIMFSLVCSFVSAMSVSSFIHRIRPRERVFYLFLFLSSTAGTILSHSRTGMTVNSIAIILILFINRKYALLAIGLILIASTVLLPQTQEYWMREQTTEQFMDMTGRVSLWPVIWDTAKNSPIYGYGFYSALRSIFDSDTTDNFYLDIFVGLGTIGIITVIIIILSMWKESIILTNFSFKINDPELKEFAGKIISVLAILTVATITGRGFSIHGESFMMFMTLVICIQSIKYGDWIHKFDEESMESYMERKEHVS